MSELVMFNRIPHKSRLTVTVTPKGGPYAAAGELFTFAGSTPVPDQQWTDAELQKGKKTGPLLKTRDYAADVFVNFASPADTEVIVTLEMVKPDDTTFGKVRTVKLTGKNGDPPSTVTIVLVMEA